MGKTWRIQSWRELFFGYALPGLGVAGWILGWLRPDEPFLPWTFFIFGLLTSAFIAITIHELAHFFAAKLLGLGPFFLGIGKGETVFEHQFRTFRFRLRTNPYSGIVYHSLPTHGRTRRRFDNLLVTLAGPLANFVLFWISFRLATARPTTLDPVSGKLIQSPIPIEIMLANGFVFLVTILPYWTVQAGVRLPSDGMKLLLLIFRPKGGWWTQKSPVKTTANAPAPWHQIVKEVPYEILLAACRLKLDDSSLSVEERHQALDAFATCVLMYGALEFLPEADRYSEELLRKNPTEWTVKGTRGSILVEKGDLQTGIEMLTDVVENDPSAFDCAIAASFLGLAEWKRNNKDAAENWLRRSFELDPNCASAHRVAEIVQTRRAAEAAGSRDDDSTRI